MVVTPKQALKTRIENEHDKLQALENLIDKQLTTRYDGNPIFINAGYVDSVIYREIERKYSEAGWKVRHVSDQREGEYISFTGGARR